MDELGKKENTEVENTEIKNTEVENTGIRNTEIEISEEEFNRQAKKAFSKAGFGMFLGYLAILPLVIITILLTVFIFRSYAINNIKRMLLFYLFLMDLVMFLSVYLNLKEMPCDNVKPTKMSIDSLIKYILVCFPVMFLGSIIGNLIEYVVFENANNPVDASYSNNFIIATISSLVMAPIFEELICRKLLIDRLAKFGEKSAILFSALCFAIIHGNLFQFFYAFGIGLIFGYIYIRTRNITYTMLGHFILNLFGGPVVYMLNGVFNEYIVGIMLLILSAIGIIVFVMNYKKIKFESQRKEASLNAMFCNPGFILLVILVIFISLISGIKLQKDTIEEDWSYDYLENIEKSLKIAAINEDGDKMVLKVEDEKKIAIAKIICYDINEEIVGNIDLTATKKANGIFNIPPNTTSIKLLYLDGFKISDLIDLKKEG